MKWCNIYIITNNINDKVYIGQTWNHFNKRFSEHKRLNSDCSKLENAFIKYGIDNFSVKLLTISHTQEVANYWEIYFINYYDSINNGYNIKFGGSYGKHSNETKQKISNAKIGSHGNFSSKTHSQESKDKMSLASLGNLSNFGKKMSADQKVKISSSMKGRIFSDEAKLKMSKSKIGNQNAKKENK